MPTVTVTDATYALAAGRTLAMQDGDSLLLYSSSPTSPSVSIAGALTVTASVDGRPPNWLISGIRIAGGGYYPAATITIQPGGLLKVDATASGPDAYGLAGGGWMPQFVNNGRIEVAAQGDAFGVLAGLTLAEDDNAVVNAGSIEVRSDLGRAYGVKMGAGDGLANSGAISATGAHVSYGVYFYQWDSRFQNAGTIRAVDSDPNEESYAVYANTVFEDAFVNTGVLQGDYALKFLNYNGPFGDDLLLRAPTRFENAGTMIGKVDLGYLRQALTNTGSIQGAVDLGSGDDTYSGALGTVTGMVSGGDGKDQLVGGPGFDNFQGNAGNDTASGGLGDDWVVGGKDNDSLAGDAGGDLVYGNIGADTCEGGDGNDIVRGGQDNDAISGGAGADYVSGDKGSDTVTGGAGADIFHTFGDAGVDRVTDFTLAEGDRVQLDPGTQYTVSQVGADTVISMTGGGQMILVGVQMSSLTAGWIFGA